MKSQDKSLQLIFEETITLLTKNNIWKCLHHVVVLLFNLLVLTLLMLKMQYLNWVNIVAGDALIPYINRPSRTKIPNMQDIKNNAWVTVNNYFWVTSEAICQRFSRVTKSRVKIIGKLHHEWPKNRYSRKRMYYFISYTLFCPEHKVLLKTIIHRSFRNCRQVRTFLPQYCDVTKVDLWRHANARY